MPGSIQTGAESVSRSRPSAGLGEFTDFYESDPRTDISAVISQMILDKIISEAYHECPLCDCSALTRGVQHPKVFCPDCGLQMIQVDRKDDVE